MQNPFANWCPKALWRVWQSNTCLKNCAISASLLSSTQILNNKILNILSWKKYKTYIYIYITYYNHRNIILHESESAFFQSITLLSTLSSSMFVWQSSKIRACSYDNPAKHGIKHASNRTKHQSTKPKGHRSCNATFPYIFFIVADFLSIKC